MATSTPSLLALPTELVEEILLDLPDLLSVHSASRTCKRIYNIYQTSELKIIRSTILRIRNLKSERKIYRLLRILESVVKQNIVQRDIALAVLQDGWKLFASEEREQLLIPFGKALAWTYASNGRKSDSICLLQKMWNQDEPFRFEEPEHAWSERPLTLLPVKQLLEKLHPICRNSSPPSIVLHEFREGIPIAEIQPRNVKWNVPMSRLNEYQRTELIKNGILFEKNLILIKFSPVDLSVASITSVHCRPFSYRYRYAAGFPPPLNTTLDTSLLIHRPNTKIQVNNAPFIDGR